MKRCDRAALPKVALKCVHIVEGANRELRVRGKEVTEFGPPNSGRGVGAGDRTGRRVDNSGARNCDARKLTAGATRSAPGQFAQQHRLLGGG